MKTCGAPSRARTYDRPVMSRMLYRLSYWSVCTIPTIMGSRSYNWYGFHTLSIMTDDNK